jgi:hypothetical protein
MCMHYNAGQIPIYEFSSLTHDISGGEMSQKIDDVLEVLAMIQRGYHTKSPRSLRDARIRAIKAIAIQRGVTHQTICDAYLRRLEPDVMGTIEFDRYTEEWLSGRSHALQEILEKHALDSKDRTRILTFFT